MHDHHGYQMCFQSRFWTMFAEVFIIDLNADVPVDTIPIKTPICWAVFVTAAPAIHAPTMNPSFKVSYIFSSSLLDPTSESTRPAQHLSADSVWVHGVNLYGSFYATCYVSPVTYSSLFNLSPVYIYIYIYIQCCSVLIHYFIKATGRL